ncbi:MAG: hypothetical protein ABS95_01110 [Verrucomicrobia bacterium SCN 57-15]|nr:MAG: hypothetical protein ABS95_01110 [Verrucomicrobia bacterium SCN 57-15]
MIFDELKTAVVQALNNDAYFSDPDAPVTVLEENRMDFYSEFEAALGKSGVGAMVSISQIRDGEVGTEIVVTVLIQFHEIPLFNRGDGGTKKPASSLAMKALAILGNRSLRLARIWSPLIFRNLALTDVDESRAMVTWSLEYEVRTLLHEIVTVMTTENNKVLVTETGKALILSPTEP